MASNVPPPPTPITNPQTGATEVYTAQPTGRSNPVIIATSITGVVTAVLGALAAFGLDISSGERDAILACIVPIVGALFVLGPIVQSFTVPYWKAKSLVDAAHQAGSVGAAKPQV
jgi:hypothetical protein